MKKNEKTMDLLLTNFSGEIVQIIVDKDIEHSLESEQGVQTVKSPVVVEGFLTDMDDHFVYVGYEPNGIHQAIHRKYIIYIGLIDEEEMEEVINGPARKPGEFN